MFPGTPPILAGNRLGPLATCAGALDPGRHSAAARPLPEPPPSCRPEDMPRGTSTGTRHHEPPDRPRSVSGRHAGRHDRCPPDLHDAYDSAQRPPALRLSLIHNLIQLRPETSSVHQSASRTLPTFA